MRKIYLVLPVIIILTFYFSFNTSESPNADTAERIVLDPIKSIPEPFLLLAEEALSTSNYRLWVPTGDFQTSSLVKLPRFPRKFTEEELKSNSNLNHFSVNDFSKNDTLRAQVVRNERFSAQIAVASIKDISHLKSEVGFLLSGTGDSIIDENINIRYVGYVPIQRGPSEFTWSAQYEDVAGPEISGTMNPNVVADPLYDFDFVDVPAYRVQPIWISIDVSEDVPPGKYNGHVTLTSDQFTEIIPLEINVLTQKIPSSEAYEFYLDLWLNCSSIAKNHEVTPWSEEHWRLIEIYEHELSSMGNKTITAIITHEPWTIPSLNNTMRSQTYEGYESMIKWILKSDGSWNFDYSIFDKFVHLALKSNPDKRINVYSITSFQGKEKIAYLDEKTNESILRYFDSPIDQEYQDVWKAFLINFREHLMDKGWLSKTYLSFDEKPNEVMQHITRMVKEFAPEFSNQISIAGHPESTKFATDFLSISYEFFPGQNLSKKETLEVIEERNQLGKLTTFYLCGQPAHPNSLSFSPAIESRVIPWLALKYNVSGYLRWSFNSWPDDPFLSPLYNFIQGDEYLIYPGGSGPISSIRWELLRDGIEDFELFKLVDRTEELSIEKRNQVIDLATRNEDGRLKKIDDFLKARRTLLLENLN